MRPLEARSHAQAILKRHPVLLDKISVSTGLEKLDVEELFEEVLKYLFVASITSPSHGLPPSVLVDKAWHEFILHTRVYSEFCQNELGKFVHHVPGRENPTEEDISRVLGLLTEHYGIVNERIWTRSSLECDGNPHCVPEPD